MMATVASQESDLRPPAPLSLFIAFRRYAWICFLFLILGLVVGALVFKMTPKVYQAKGTFLIDKLPFGSASENRNDAETDRQLVQSLILSIPGEEMRKTVASRLNVPETDISFADHDLPIALSGPDKRKSNVEVTATRNSRLGVISAESADPTFAAQVVNAVFDEVDNINKIAGSMEQITSRLKIASAETDSMIQELTTASADRIKFQQQNLALKDFNSHKSSINAFPAFAQDEILNNLNTQLILVSSQYDSIAAQSSLGSRLEGKKAELDGLRGQIETHLEGLVAALHSSLQIAQTRETSLRSDLTELQQRMTALETLQAELAKGFGDFNIRQAMVAKIDPGLVSESSVFVVIDPAYAIQRPVRPVLSIDLALGAVLGATFGLGTLLLITQLRPSQH